MKQRSGRKELFNVKRLRETNYIYHLEQLINNKAFVSYKLRTLYE